MKDKNNIKPKYNILQSVAFMVKRAWNGPKVVLLDAAVIIICEVGIAVFGLLAAPAVIAKIENAATLSELLWTIAFFTIGLVVCGAGLRYADTNKLYPRVEIRLGIIADFNTKNYLTSYPNINDPDFLNRFERVRSATDNNRTATENIWLTLTDFLKNVITFVIYLLLISTLSPIIMLAVLLLSVAGYVFSYKINAWGYAHKDEEADYDHRLEYICSCRENISLAKDIKIFSLRGWMQEIYDKSMKLLCDFYRREQRAYLTADLIDVLLSLMRNGIAYAWLIYQVINGGLTASEFLLYFSAISGFAAWVNGILSGLTALTRECREISTIMEFLEEPEPFKFEDGASLPKVPDDKYTIELHDVSFRYPGTDHDVLSHIDLTLHSGEKLAIVGMNGEGKTTLVKLACGFLDPTDGVVLLNGQDIRQYNRREYYRLFSAVFQDFSLLAGSIEENVAQADTVSGLIDSHRVTECLEKAGLMDKVNSLPNGTKTMLDKTVYDEAIQLSGGETQKLMLARALYKNGPIIVLDEPTAALDPIAESELYSKYNDLTSGKSSIYISHRLASTRFCDRILLISNSKIAEDGTHEELLALGGLYADMFEVQRQYYKDSEGDETDE